jgi:DNA repair protein RecN (Recombination protein N)
MISGLSVANFAVAKKLTLELDDGLTIITGETGAGKSILVGALLVGLGGKWKPESLRHGADKATVELVFRFKQQDLNLLEDKTVLEDNELIASRTIDAEGKSRIRIGGMQTTLNALRETTSKLVDVHSQFDAQSLLDPRIHQQLLDRFAGLDHLKNVEQFGTLATQLRQLQVELKRMLGSEEERKRRLDYIAFELEDFEKIKPEPGEDSQLEQERTRLLNIAKLADLAGTIKSAMDGVEDQQGIISLSKNARKTMADLLRIDNSAQEALPMVESLLANSSEVSVVIGNYLSELTFDPERLEQIESRLNDLGKITRRFGSKLDDVFSGIQKLKSEMDALANAESRIGQITQEIETVRAKLGVMGTKVRTGRLESSKNLAKAIVTELSDLALEKASFSVNLIPFEPSENLYCRVDGADVGISESGTDAVEFVISTNPGEPPKSIQKVASGGELSRIMLALKVILSEVDQTPTLIFDEVDSGVGGRIGEMIGRKLATLARKRQIICITHLPQIAAFADRHLEIVKHVVGDETNIECLELAQRGRIEELARMGSGDKISQVSLKHAEELLLEAKKFKTVS